MCIVWLSATFCFYLIQMLSNTFKDEYVTGIVNGSAEFVANITSGFMYIKIGVKPSLIVSFLISTVGGALILIWGLDNQETAYFEVFFMLAKFGVTICFAIAFAANQYFFPTLFAATALGICNFLARLFAAISFLIDNIEEPTPIIIFTICCTATAVASFFLRTGSKLKADDE